MTYLELFEVLVFYFLARCGSFTLRCGSFDLRCGSFNLRCGSFNPTSVPPFLCDAQLCLMHHMGYCFVTYFLDSKNTASRRSR